MAAVRTRSTPSPMPESRVAEPAPATVAREVLRPTIPGRAVALNRAGKPVQRAAAENGVDQFAIPRHLPPPDWSWEWKEESVLGEVRQGESAKQAQVGWEPVMYESYPGVFAPEFDERGAAVKGPVRRGGLMLKERPMVLTVEARMDEKRKADEKVGNAKRQYNRLDTNGTTTAEFDHSAQRASYIRQTHEVVSTPSANGRQPID